MLQSSTADALKKVLQGVSAQIQANDADELEYNEIAREVTRKSRDSNYIFMVAGTLTISGHT